jgi:hypothetical protein
VRHLLVRNKAVLVLKVAVAEEAPDRLRAIRLFVTRGKLFYGFL